MAKNDGVEIWKKELMGNLLAIRGDYRHAYNSAWRDERLFRYVFWLKNGEHPDFNITGSWEDKDIINEIELCKFIKHKEMSNDEAYEFIVDILENRYEIKLDDAVKIGTCQELAEKHLPIWNAETGSLLPQEIGPCVIYRCYDHDKDNGVGGKSYNYCDEDRNIIYTITIHKICDGLLHGINDNRLSEYFDKYIIDVLESNSINSVIDYVQEKSVHCELYENDFEINGYVSGFTNTNKENNSYWNTLYMTAMCGMVIKARATISMELLTLDVNNCISRAITNDFINYVGHYGQPENINRANMLSN